MYIIDIYFTLHTSHFILIANNMNHKTHRHVISLLRSLQAAEEASFIQRLHCKNKPLHPHSSSTSTSTFISTIQTNPNPNTDPNTNPNPSPNPDPDPEAKASISSHHSVKLNASVLFNLDLDCINKRKARFHVVACG